MGGPSDPEGWTPQQLLSIDGIRAVMGPPTEEPALPRWDWEEQRTSMLLSAHAHSTRKQYATGWERWKLFCRLRSLEHPFLTREGGANALRREENLPLDFAVWQHQLGLAEGTIRSTL